jgi:hypothetical protein
VIAITSRFPAAAYGSSIRRENNDNPPGRFGRCVMNKIRAEARVQAADRPTDFTILGFSMFAALVVVAVSLTASPKAPDLSASVRDRAPVFTVGQPLTWPGSATGTIR